MGRLAVCLLLALALPLTGCGTPGPINMPDNEDARHTDFWGKPLPSGEVTLGEWLDDNPGVMYGAAILIAVGAVVAAVALTAARTPSLVGRLF
jgi:hypothetical protein